MVCFWQGLPLVSNLTKTVVLTSARKSLQLISPVCINSIRNASDNDTAVENKNVVDETLEQSMSWELLVDYSKLSPKDLKIHRRHAEAVRNKKLTYIDPATGYIVMSRLSHLTRGECCGNACRHCPYGQKSVPDDQKKKFNSAFYS